MLQSTKHRLSTRCNCCMVPFAATAVSRRELLAGGAAALAIGTAAGFAPTVFAQAAPHRIDVHHHVSPPTWLDAVKSMKKDTPPMVSWSVQKSLDDMDKGGVATAITSPTTPQVNRGSSAKRTKMNAAAEPICSKSGSNRLLRCPTSTPRRLLRSNTEALIGPSEGIYNCAVAAVASFSCSSGDSKNI